MSTPNEDGRKAANSTPVAKTAITCLIVRPCEGRIYNGVALMKRLPRADEGVLTPANLANALRSPGGRTSRELGRFETSNGRATTRGHDPKRTQARPPCLASTGSLLRPR